MSKYKYTRIKQIGGDDGYCWAVFVNDKERVNGLTRREAEYYRRIFEKEETDKYEANRRSAVPTTKSL